MSKKQQQFEQPPKEEKNPFAGLDRNKLIEIALRQEKFIQQQENDINNLLQGFVTYCKITEEWGKNMIHAGATFFETMLTPSVKMRLPPELAPGSVPKDMAPMTKEEAMKEIEKLKAMRLANLEKIADVKKEG
jgi:hypothetical protein